MLIPILAFVTVLLLVTQSISSDVGVIPDFLHLNNFGRYASCPFHEINRFEFSCFIQNQTKVNRIIRNTLGSMVDLKEQLPRLTNQTILFVGDSLVEDQFVSLACLLWEADFAIQESDLFFHDNDAQRIKLHENVSHHKNGQAVRFFAVRSNTYNLEIQYTFSGTLLNLHETLLGRINNNTIAQEVLYAEWQALIEGRFEPVVRAPTIIMLSAGHHLDRRKYTVKSNPQNSSALVNTTKTIEAPLIDRQLVELIFNHVNSELKKIMRVKNKKFRVIMRSVPPRHYSNGEWNTGGTCNDELPLSQQNIQSKLRQGDEHYTVPLMLLSILKDCAKRWGVEVLDILPYAMTRSDAMVGSTAIGRHGAKSDCSHYCVPGVPDMWNSLLIDQILNH